MLSITKDLYLWYSKYSDMSENEQMQIELVEGIPNELPNAKKPNPSYSHAPVRNIIHVLSRDDKKLAVKNALRYFKEEHHPVLAKEFYKELNQYGRIYMYRYLPSYDMFARPIGDYPAKCHQAAAIMLMIQNNLDPKVAKHPEELITYGGNGAVFQNWVQYRLTMQYLSEKYATNGVLISSELPIFN